MIRFFKTRTYIGTGLKNPLQSDSMYFYTVSGHFITHISIIKWKISLYDAYTVQFLLTLP